MANGIRYLSERRFADVENRRWTPKQNAKGGKEQQGASQAPAKDGPGVGLSKIKPKGV